MTSRTDFAHPGEVNDLVVDVLTGHLFRKARQAAAGASSPSLRATASRIAMIPHAAGCVEELHGTSFRALGWPAARTFISRLIEAVADHICETLFRAGMPRRGG